jgi:hypothetical protein
MSRARVRANERVSKRPKLAEYDRPFDPARWYREPPCTGCPNRVACTARALACQEFVAYVQTGIKRRRPEPAPTRERYVAATMSGAGRAEG